MSPCRFSVSKIAVEPNIRGDEMRRVVFQALPADPFVPSTPTADGQEPANPDGSITILVNREFAERFSLGDTFTVSFLERD